MQIRESIKNLFPNRDCFSLVRPMSDESQLAKLETIPPEQMRPQFIEVSPPMKAIATAWPRCSSLFSFSPPDMEGSRQAGPPPAHTSQLGLWIRTSLQQLWNGLCPMENPPDIWLVFPSDLSALDTCRA